MTHPEELKAIYNRLEEIIDELPYNKDAPIQNDLAARASAMLMSSLQHIEKATELLEIDPTTGQINTEDWTRVHLNSAICQIHDAIENSTPFLETLTDLNLNDARKVQNILFDIEQMACDAQHASGGPAIIEKAFGIQANIKTPNISLECATMI